MEVYTLFCTITGIFTNFSATFVDNAVAFVMISSAVAFWQKNSFFSWNWIWIKMGNKQGSLSNHLETASKTGALAFPGKVREFKFVDFRFIWAKNVIKLFVILKWIKLKICKIGTVLSWEHFCEVRYFLERSGNY